MRARRTLLAASAGACLIAAASLPLPPRLIWNRTASMPPGLYVVTQPSFLARDDLVAYAPPPAEADWLASRGYTGAGWPLIKRIAALEGDEVCRRGDTVFVNAAPAAKALTEDAAGRSLPAWRGCRTLQPGDLLLLAEHPNSVDGRYLGIQETQRILGAAVPLWLPERRSGQSDPRLDSGTPNGALLAHAGG